MRNRCFVGLFTLGAAIGLGQPLQPTRVIDLRPQSSSLFNSSDIRVVDIAQNNGRWAALVASATGKQSQVVVGDDVDLHSSAIIPVGSDRIALDGAGNVYNRVASSSPNSTEIQLRDWSLRASASHRIEGSGFGPVSWGRDVVWRQGAIGNLLFRLSTGDPVAHLNQPGEQTPWVPVELQNEIRLVFGLPGGRSLQVGTLSEEVVVHENDGKVVSRNTLAMDDAYRVANDVPPVHDPLSGMQRMLWASLSNAGELFVCLSGVPLSKPANIAQFDPMTGHVVKVIEAQLPRSPERVDKYNPDGFIGPFLGAVDDRIVIADGPLGLVAVYKLNYGEKA